MTVTLQPPLLGGPPDSRILQEPLTEAPTFIVKRHPQRHGRLWHRPRSGYIWLCEWRPDELVTTFNLWCGTFVHGDRCETSDEPPLGDAVCGTCEGRAQGAGQIAAGQAQYRILFMPRYATAPRWCPGSGIDGLWAEEPGGTRACPAAVCLVCGSHERVRSYGGFYNSRPGLTKHQPADGLMATRCDMHAWRHLIKARTVDDRVVAICRCEVS